MVPLLFVPQITAVTPLEGAAQSATLLKRASARAAAGTAGDATNSVRYRYCQAKYCWICLFAVVFIKEQLETNELTH